MGWEWLGNKAGMGRERSQGEMEVQGQSCTTQGKLWTCMTLQSHSKLGPDGLAFNLPYCSVFEYGPPQKPRQSLKGLTAESCLLKALPRVGATNPLLKEQLGSVLQCPPQAITEIKH